MMHSDISLIAVLAFSVLLPFVIAAGTCFLKISIVLVMVRNAMGVQQVPSTIALNGIALLLSLFVMMPIIQDINIWNKKSQISFSNPDSVITFIDEGLGKYKNYLSKYSDKDLVDFFDNLHKNRVEEQDAEDEELEPELFSLLPAYALSEIKSAFEIGFYIYLPFVVIDLIISSILLALGMMMMSPVTISVPIKLILFVAIDGWAILSKGLIMQYIDLAQQ